MKKIEVKPDLKLEEILQQMQGEDVIVTKQGHAIALLSDFDDEEMYWYGRENDPEFLASLARAREQVAKGQTVTLEELKKELGIE